MLATSTVAGLPATDDIGVVSLLLFWGMAELGVGMVAICLPTLRPLLVSWSIEKVIQSVRSVISLHSLASSSSQRGSKGRCQGPTTNNNVEPKASEEELVDMGSSRFHSEQERGRSQGHVTGGGVERIESFDTYEREGIHVERDFQIDPEQV